ncbi:hypothetical protein CLV59_103286 [Chitinophaga dinghuensis]|uniref:Lipoprotein n=1 Tax=Chitinophaga dinghuensis TaxID=1539050 RepID=A0A327W3F7_9BACT|nr:hypothetical protein [Chitinophaga dinghuensis]RAJ83322.1 hypothetical protein CLV59_103286 [Chitinophaga dinghuensis]
MVRLLGMFLALMCCSCGFNITDGPGPQVSSSVEISQEAGTFICEYKGKTADSTANDIPIKQIFIEKQYHFVRDFYLKKVISCCTSQLVIVTEQPLSGYAADWKLKDFTRQSSSYRVIKELNEVQCPDSILLNYISLNGKGEAGGIIKAYYVYRVK